MFKAAKARDVVAEAEAVGDDVAVVAHEEVAAARRWTPTDIFRCARA